MNKKIYFNHKFIVFTDEEGGSDENALIKVYKYSNETALREMVNSFLSTSDPRPVKVFIKERFEKILEQLKNSFAYIEAAGGFIEKENEFLFIHRHGRWDLPKGKLEKKETVEAAAIRECEEECGVKDLIIIKPLSSTFHIYPYKSGYALKQTFWFYMKTDYALKLSPQLEEHIEEVRWFNKNEITSVIIKDTYFTISDIIKEALKL